MNNIDNPQPINPIRGLEDAQNLLKSRMKSFMLLKQNQARNLNQPEQPVHNSLLNQSNQFGNQCGKSISRYQPFEGQAQEISISERVKRASQCHGKMLDEIEKTRISHYQSVETALNAVKTTGKTNQNISSTIQNDVGSKNTVSQSKPFQFHSFASNSQPRNNLQNLSNISSEKPSNQLFSGQNLNNQAEQPGNKFVFPNTNTNTATPALGLFGQVNSENKFNQPQSSQNKYQASSNLFGQIPQQNNLFAKSNGSVSFSNQPEQTFQNQKQGQKPQIPLEPVKPALNLFAEHLFSDVKENKNAKPSLLFNNNSISVFTNKKDEKQTSQIKVMFNNNGTVVPKIVPSTNIFGGQLSIHPQKEQISNEKASNQGQNQSIFAPKINTQIEAQPGLNSQVNNSFSPSKPIQPQRVGLFGVQPKSQENNSNQQIFKANSGIFGNQTASIPKQQQPNRPLFETTPAPAKEENRYTFGKAASDNNQIKLFSSNKESNGSTGVSLLQSKPNPQKLQPAKLQPAKPVLGLFGNQSLPTTNIFGAKKQPQQPSAPKPTTGLFGNITAGNSNAEKKQQQKKESAKPVLGLFSNNQTTNLFGSKNVQQNPNLNPNVSSNNLFSKKNEPNLPSANPTQNMFAKPSTGLFAKTPVQQKTFSQITSSNNIFAASNQPVTNNIFLSNQNSSTGLFSGNQSLFSNNNQSLFGGNNQKRGASLFTNTQDNDNQDDDDADGSEGAQSDNDLEESPSEEEQKGEMKFKDYIQTQIFAKAEANKLKIVSEDKLLNDMKLSLQKISDDPKTYLIARLPNKNIAFYVLFISKSELHILNEKQGVINLSIKSLFQIDVLNGNKKSIDSLRIQLKQSPDSRKFIQECQKLIKNALEEEQRKKTVQKQVQKETQRS